jgi:hypothetical protein
MQVVEQMAEVQKKMESRRFELLGLKAIGAARGE